MKTNINCKSKTIAEKLEIKMYDNVLKETNQEVIRESREGILSKGISIFMVTEYILLQSRGGLDTW